MFLLQYLFRMLNERQAGILFVVLRADRQDNPSRTQRQGHLLHRQEGLAAGASLSQFDSFKSVVANDAAP